MKSKTGFSTMSNFIEYFTEDLAIFFVFATYAKMMPEDFDQGLEVLVATMYVISELEDKQKKSSLKDWEKDALQIAQQAILDNHDYIFVEYVGEEEPDPDQQRHYELFGVNS